MSLHLGNEIFDLQRTKAMPNLHLFTRQGASLQAQAPFKQKLTFRPHSTDTLTHRKMTMNMADKSNRTQKVKMVTDVGMNPEKARLVSFCRCNLTYLFRKASKKKTKNSVLWPENKLPNDELAKELAKRDCRVTFWRDMEVVVII